MVRKYETILYKDPTKGLLIGIFLMLMAIAIFIYLGRLYHSVLLGFGPSFTILILPILFSKRIKRKFLSEKAILDLEDQSFSITLYSLASDVVVSQDVFLWRDIMAYKFYFDTKNNTCLTLYLKDGDKKAFIFNDRKAFEQAVNENSVFSNFYFFVKQLNNDGQQISPRPSLLATGTGKIIISLEIGLIIIAFVLHIINHTFSNSYYLIFGIVLVIPQIVNRQQNKSVYDKIVALD